MMEPRDILNAACGGLLLVALAGCFSTASRPPVKAWTIEPVEETAPAGPVHLGELSPPPFKATRLGSITVLPPYDGTQFRVKRGDGTLAEDAYNVFASAPVQLLRRPAMDALSKEPRFGHVLASTSTAASEAVAEILVSELALDCREGRKATVKLDVNVVKGREVVLSGAAAGEADAASGNYSDAFSKAFGDAMKNSLRKLK